MSQRSIFRLLALLVALSLAVGAYIVRKGDTLWDLSAQFLNNPFAWPDLWEQNRHIRDPHWIYPGDSLYISGVDGEMPSAVAQPAPEPKQPAPYVPDSLLPGGVVNSGRGFGTSRDDEFRRKLGGLKRKGDSELGANNADSTIFFYRKSEEAPLFNRHYLARAPFALDLENYRADASWFNVRPGGRPAPMIVPVGAEILINATRTSGVAKEDLIELLILEETNMRLGADTTPQPYVVARRAGLARVQSVGDSLCRAVVLQAFHPLEPKKIKARKFSPLPDIQVKSFTLQSGARAEDMGLVSLLLDANLTAGPYSHILVRHPKRNDWSPGDGVAVWEWEREDPTLPPRLLARGMVVQTARDHSTVLLREVYFTHRRVELDLHVSLTHKASSL